MFPPLFPKAQEKEVMGLDSGPAMWTMLGLLRTPKGEGTPTSDPRFVQTDTRAFKDEMSSLHLPSGYARA